MKSTVSSSQSEPNNWLSSSSDDVEMLSMTLAEQSGSGVAVGELTSTVEVLRIQMWH
jgi:hypothetical protein